MAEFVCSTTAVVVGLGTLGWVAQPNVVLVVVVLVLIVVVAAVSLGSQAVFVIVLLVLGIVAAAAVIASVSTAAVVLSVLAMGSIPCVSARWRRMSQPARRARGQRRVVADRWSPPAAHWWVVRAPGSWQRVRRWLPRPPPPPPLSRSSATEAALSGDGRSRLVGYSQLFHSKTKCNSH